MGSPGVIYSVSADVVRCKGLAGVGKCVGLAIRFLVKCEESQLLGCCGKGEVLIYSCGVSY